MSIWSRIERRLTDLAGEILPDDVREQLDLARDQLTAGNADAAADVLRAVIDARPDHLGALSLLGVAELERDEPAAALEAFEQALAARSDLADAHIGRGQALMALGRIEDASLAFRAAVEAAAGDRDILSVAYRGSGLAYRRLGALDKAVRELRKAVAEAPRDPLALTALGEALHVHPDISDEEAKKYLGWAMEGEAPALAFLISGQIALIEGRASDASELFGKAATRAELSGRSGERSAALIGAADVALAEGQLTDAHQSLMRALELVPDSVEVHARLADLHGRSGNLEAALAAFDHAASLGASAEVLAQAIVHAIDERDHDRLLRYADALRSADPDPSQRVLADVAAAIARALTLDDDESPDAVRAELERILATSEAPDAHIALGELLVGETPTLAAEHALAALRAAPARTRARARELLGRARRAELGVAADEEMNADIVAAFTGLERLSTARPELATLTRGIAEAAGDFDRPLLVTVMGEFSSGKSTFVNAFIGAEVAPTGITPTTATINVVRHGRERGGRILYRDDKSEEVAWDALFGRLRALDESEAARISRVEILLPLDILERVNLVDTPGLNSILPEHEKVAREFIARADAVVWVFSAGQAGKKTEGDALATITAQGVRVLGALNKIDQLSESDVDTVTKMVNDELGHRLEAVVPVSARLAAEGKDGSRWADLELALEEHFFARANKLKESAARRKLADIVAAARAITETRTGELAEGAARLEAVAIAVREHGSAFGDKVAAAERRTLASELGTLYRDAAREVLELVLPRRLPFGNHKASPADRDYLISLLETRLEAALGRSRKRAIEAIRERCADAIRVEHELIGLSSSRGLSMPAIIDDAATLFEARVYSSVLAYLSGYLRGGFVEHFFRSDLPKIDLAEDAVYHALYRDSPNVDALVGAKLASAGEEALRQVAERVDGIARTLTAEIIDLEEGTLEALEALQARAG